MEIEQMVFNLSKELYYPHSLEIGLNRVTSNNADCFFEERSIYIYIIPG